MDSFCEGASGALWRGGGQQGGGDDDLAPRPYTHLDVVVGEGAAILELLTSEDQSLLVRRDALLVLDLSLDIVNGVRGLDLKRDRLASKRLNEDLHLCVVGGERDTRQHAIHVVMMFAIAILVAMVVTIDSAVTPQPIRHLLPSTSRQRRRRCNAATVTHVVKLWWGWW